MVPRGDALQRLPAVALGKHLQPLGQRRNLAEAEQLAGQILVEPVNGPRQLEVPQQVTPRPCAEQQPPGLRVALADRLHPPERALAAGGGGGFAGLQQRINERTRRQDRRGNQAQLATPALGDKGRQQKTSRPPAGQDAGERFQIARVAFAVAVDQPDRRRGQAGRRPVEPVADGHGRSFWFLVFGFWFLVFGLGLGHGF